MCPIPLVEGQISLLTSLVIHSWWLTPRVDPAAVTIPAAPSGSAMTSAQPRMAPLISLVAVSAYAGSLERRSVLAQIASWSIAVPTSFQSITEKSAGWYSFPVSGLTASSSCAYSL